MDLAKIKDVKDLQSLLDLMGRYNLAEIEIEGEGHKIRLRKAEPPAAKEVMGYPMAMPPLAAAGLASPPPPGAAGAPPAAGAAAPAQNLREVPSPMVGTFYRSSSPEAEPFVKEGDSVTAEQVLCIIEAMKVMNEIPGGIAGVVREVLVKNGQSVEFGQALFRIEVT